MKKKNKSRVYSFYAKAGDAPTISISLRYKKEMVKIIYDLVNKTCSHPQGSVVEVTDMWRLCSFNAIK